MSHYDLVQWVDFIRGLGDPAQATAMRQHLDGACEPCGAIVRRLGAVAHLASVDDRYEPPAHLVRFARAAFSLHRPERLLSWPQLATRLVFNSCETALAVGARGPVEEMSRQTLYEAGDFSVHLRFEQASGTSRISLIGQVANRRLPVPPMSHLPVLLVRGRAVVARSLSNEFGEFQLEYEPDAALRLHIPLSEGRQSIHVALNDVQNLDAAVPAPRPPRTGAGRGPSGGRQ
jgi:hypothetical protein